MKNLFALALSLIALVALNADAADSFADHVAKARRAERAPENRPALAAFMEQTSEAQQKALNRCFKKTMPPDHTLVADLMPDGTVANVAIEPMAPGLECYLDAFRKITFKADLPARYRDTGLPIVIESSFRETGGMP